MTDLSEHYDEQQWKGLGRFACRLCPFDTLDGEAAVLDHLRRTHFRPPPRPPAILPRVTRFGKVIEPWEQETVLESEEQLLEDGIDLSALTVDNVLALVEQGELEAKLVIETERRGKNRKSLLQKLGEEG